MINLAVFISGNGSNLKAIIDSINSGYLDKVNLAVVIANKECSGLSHAVDNIIYHVICHADAESDILATLMPYNIDLIALAGFDQILSPSFIDRFKHRIMNIHPSLLPSFANTLHAQQQALDHGVKISGCTVHFATSVVDSGPIIIQAAVPVKDSDTVSSLSERILSHEHIIYPKAIKLFSEDRLSVVDNKVIVSGSPSISYISRPNRVLTMNQIGVSNIDHLLDKSVTHTLLINNISPREAMVLKQELLSLGGDCAVPRDCILNNLVFTDVILLGNIIQLRQLASKLRTQSFNLPIIADLLNGFIENEFGGDLK